MASLQPGMTAPALVPPMASAAGPRWWWVALLAGGGGCGVGWWGMTMVASEEGGREKGAKEATPNHYSSQKILSDLKGLIIV